MKIDRLSVLSRVIEVKSLLSSEPPDEDRRNIYRGFLNNYYNLKSSLPRSKTDPFLVVELFSQFESLLTKAPEWAWPEILEQLNRIRIFVLNLEPKLSKCLADTRRMVRKTTREERWSDPWWRILAVGVLAAYRGEKQVRIILFNYLSAPSTFMAIINHKALPL